MEAGVNTWFLQNFFSYIFSPEICLVSSCMTLSSPIYFLNKNIISDKNIIEVLSVPWLTLSIYMFPEFSATKFIKGLFTNTLQ